MAEPKFVLDNGNGIATVLKWDLVVSESYSARGWFVATIDFIADRRSPRQKVVIPIALVADVDGERTMVPASALDVSSGGLRIRTSVCLSVGELVNVQFEESPSGLRQYEVVWTKPAGALWPGVAGLRAAKSAGGTLLAPAALSHVEPQISAA